MHQEIVVYTEVSKQLEAVFIGATNWNFNHRCKFPWQEPNQQLVSELDTIQPFKVTDIDNQ